MSTIKKLKITLIFSILLSFLIIFNLSIAKDSKDSKDSINIIDEGNLTKNDIANIEVNNITEDKNIEEFKSILNIDTNINGNTFDRTGIHIEGWKLATVGNTKLKVYIDEKEMDESNIKYSYKYDLISIVSGYGTYTENPTPNFDIDIPVDNISQGQHSIRIEFVTSDGNILQKSEGIITIDKSIKSILNLDTSINGNIFDRTGIHIEGWKLANLSNTELKVYIDGKEIDKSNIKYSYKYDLISIVQGYGTYAENPTPNFDIDIPVDNISQGQHLIEIEFVTSDGDILQKSEGTISIDKNIKSILNLDTSLNNVTFYKGGIHIEGWKLANLSNTELKVYIDGKETDEGDIKYSYKYDLISIVSGYGTYAENPTPNFDIDIPVDNISQGQHSIKIEFITSEGKVLQKSEGTITIDKSTKSILNLDTSITNSEFDSRGIHIEGWKLSTEKGNKLKVYIDEKEIDESNIKYSYKYDLISIVPGYGTYVENPMPNFDIDITLDGISDGNHSIIIELITEDEKKVLEKREGTIKTTNSFFQMHIETIFDRTTITNEVHSLSGWMMSDKKDTNIRIMIDGNYIDNQVTRTQRTDVNQYFNYAFQNENPTPGFSTQIDFSKYSIGLHQIAVRVFDMNGVKLGETVIYVFLEPKITISQGTYGVSGLAKIGDSRGSNLTYYRYGDGPNVFFATFSVHGFEDNWYRDGQELKYIADKFFETLKNEHSQDVALASKWTIYILPTVNPDGMNYGTTNNGPGRTTLYSLAPRNKGIDLNRCWKYSGFNANASSRNYAGTAPFQAYEAQYLRDFLQANKSVNGQTVLVDLHGWLQQLIGDREIGMYYAVQFPENNGYSLDRYGDGYLINWARTALASNGRLARTSLIELPGGSYNHQSVVDRNFAGKYIQATLSMLNGLI